MFPDVLDLPRPFGPYTLLRRLAVGGMAEVYVAKAEGIGGFEKLVAIKVIHPRFSEDQTFIQMLVDEAKLSVLLTHVNVAQTFDLGCIDDNYFIVMEFVEGADASQVLRRVTDQNVRIPVDLCAYMVSELCHGLDYAHRKKAPSGEPLNIVHRDVSPQNVLVSFSGEVKVADFGIAKAAQRTGQTEAGVIKGKYFYMSPEQAWADPLDGRSDIFSAGIVLHELLTGEMVYEADNLPKLLEKVRKADVQAPSKFRKDVPPELDAIVMKALHEHPSERWESGQAMAQALTQFLYRYMPTFTAARLAALMAELFPKEMEAATGGAELSSDERVLVPASGDKVRIPTEPMASGEFQPDRTKSIIFKDENLGKESEGENGAAKRRALFEDESTSDALPSLGPDSQIDDEATGVWEDASSAEAEIARTTSPPNEEWDDSTVVESGAQARLKAAREAAQGLASARQSAEQPITVPPPPRDPTPWPFIAASTNDSFPQMGSVPDLSGWKEDSDVFSAPPAPLSLPPSRPLRARRSWLLPMTLVLMMGVVVLIWANLRSPVVEETRIELVSVPEGAVVRVDGDLIEGRTPLFLEQEITDGQRLTIEATLPNYQSWRRSFEVEPGHTRHIAVFIPLRTDVVIDSEPSGAQIDVGGERLGSAPVTLRDAPLGRVLNVRATKRGHLPVTRRFTVDGENSNLVLELPPVTD
ncbi:MAG: protein kinase [Polyangiales bacterium]